MLGKLNPKQQDVTILGAGISGLLLAYRLDQLGYRVRLIETQNRVGGLLDTQMTPRGMAEAAAHSLLATPQVQTLFRDLGVEWTEVRSASRARFILRKGKMRRFPLSPSETLGMVVRLVSKRAAGSFGSALSVGEWSHQFLGDAARNYLMASMIQGIYASSPDEISVRAAFPEWEIPTGHSFMSFRLAEKLKNKNKRSYGKMIAPLGGMKALVDALKLRLERSPQVRLELGASVRNLDELGSVGNMILATPADVAGRLLEPVGPALANALQKVSYAPLVSATVFIRRDQVTRIPNGVGVLLPAREKMSILGILFNSSSFPGRVSDEQQWISLSVLMGGTQRPEMILWTEDQMKQMIEKDLQFLFGLQGGISSCVIHRWKRAIPLYNEDLISVWNRAREGWCAPPGRLLFGNYTGKVSLRGMIETVVDLKGSES